MRVPTTEAELTTWLVGDSEETLRLRRLILRIAPTTLPVWIEGETGVGKEQVAQALHAASGRPGAFVAVNVCAIAETMLEDAFFGHVRGAFTGAHSETCGYFGEADGGTLFLDEISGLPLDAQAKLLRAVETLRFRQVGARADRQSSLRIIAASNEPFDRLLRGGRFRPDLGFRLRGSVLHVPPLRERRVDVKPLAMHFLADGAGDHQWTITENALGWLESQPWVGNVRELRQVLRCAQLLASGMRLGTDDLRSSRQMIPADGPDLRDLSRASSQERDELERVLAQCDWDTRSAAVALGVDRTTVYRRMRRLGIEAPRAMRRGRMDVLVPVGMVRPAVGANRRP